MQQNDFEINLVQFEKGDNQKSRNKQRYHFNTYFLVSFIIISIIALIILGYYSSQLNSKIESLNKEKEELDILMNNQHHVYTEVPEVNILNEILFPHKTDIIKSLHELNLLREWTGKGGLLQVYKSSIDGSNSAVFHNKTKNYRKLLLVMKTQDKITGEEHRFGAFTKYNFEHNKFPNKLQFSFVPQSNGFIYSLDEEKMYRVSDVMESLPLEANDFLKDNNKLLLNEPTKICSNKSDSCSIQEIEVYKVYYYDE